MENSGMMFQEFEAMMGMGILEALISELPSMLINLAVYIFTGLGLYTIAKRRGIHNPWLAWVPLANMWLLGCISDHYQSVANGKVTRRRVALLVTNILMTLVAVAVVVLCFVMLTRLFAFGMDNLDNFESLEFMDQSVAEELMASIMGPGVGMVLLALVMFPVGIVYMVFYCMSLHDVYKSCEPANATLYLVLGIFITVCAPIFLMICRNKDGGMPVRMAQPAYNPYEPPYQPPYGVPPQSPYQPPYSVPPQPPVEKDPWED